MRLKSFGARCSSLIELRGRSHGFATGTSLVAIAATTASVCLPAMAHAQSATDDETITTEIVAVEGQDLDGETLGGFLPVVIGGEGDLLFLSRTASDLFITFDGSLDRVTGATAVGLQNGLRGTYSIDSFGDQFAITTNTGIVTGSVSNSVANTVSFGTSFDAIPIRNQGNLGDGASPLILNQQIALNLSNVSVNEADGSFIGNTADFTLFASAGSNLFEQVGSFSFDRDNQTSLNFAGGNGLLASFSAQLSSANGAATSNLRRLNLASGITSGAIQIGPNGNPQLSSGGALLGGDLSFGGFTFFGDGVFGTGASFATGAFSANSSDTAFVLGNASLALDGTPGDSVAGQLLVLNDQVILTARNNGGLTVSTSVGDLDILRFEEVILADNGDILFTTADFFRTGGDPARELANSVGLWRIINPGEANQAIIPVIREGDALIITDSGIDDLFPGFIPPDAAEIVGFDTTDIARSQGLTSDGRPQLFSVNQQGHIATIVQIDGANGPVDALIAQDDNGDFHVVAFIGQLLDVNGQGDLRRITNFTAQFGSNDVDGAGDLFNLDEQLGFIVTLDDINTSGTEFDRAVLRISLNGVETIQINEFLWEGGCGDDEFSTTCQIFGENGSNWVNANDTDQIAENAPGIFDLGTDAATIRGSDVRISVLDVNLLSLNSDSTVTIQDGRTLTLGAASQIDELVVENGVVANAQTLTTRLTTVSGDATLGRIETAFLDVDGTLTLSDAINVSDEITFTDGTITGSGTLSLAGDDLDTVPILTIAGRGNRLATELTVEAGQVVFDDGGNLSIDTGGILRLTGGSTTALRDGSITGVGEFALEDGSSFTATGTVLVAPDIVVRDGAGAGGPAQSAIAATLGTSLRLDNLTFTREASGEIADDEFAQVSIGRSASIFINEASTLTIDDQVRLIGEGTLQIDGTLSLADRGLFENEGTVQTLTTRLHGDGVFVNTGTLTFTDTVQDDAFREAGITIGVQFANIEGGILDHAGSLTFQTENLREVTSSIDLRARGLERLGLDLGAGAQDLPDIGVLLEFAPDEGNNPASRSTSLNFVGDGSVFLIGDLSIEGSATLNIFTDAILSGSVASANAVRLFANDATLPGDVFIANNGPNAGWSLSGDGGLLASGVNLIGVSAPPLAIGEEASRAIFANAFGETLIENRAFFGTTFQDGLVNSQIDGFIAGQASLRNVTLDNIDILNTGILDLQSSSIVDGSNVRIVNSGGLRLGEGFQNKGRLELETQNTASLLEISGALSEDFVIDDVNNIAGRFRIGTTGAQVIVRNFEQLITTSNAQDTAQLLVVAEGSELSIEESNLVLNGESEGEVEFVGRARIGGKIELFEGDELSPLTQIAQGASISIGDGGTINSLDEDGAGLTRVEGSFFGTGRFTGENLTVTSQGASATFDKGIESTTLTLGEGADFNVSSGNAASTETVVLSTIELGGELQVRTGAVRIDTINAIAGSSALIDGSITFETFMLAGSLRNNRTTFEDSSPELATLKGTTLTIAGSGSGRADKVEVETLTIEEGGSLRSDAETNFRTADIAGELTVQTLADLEPNTLRTLTVAATGEVKFTTGGTLTSLAIADGGQLTSNSPLLVQAPRTSIDGLLEAIDDVTFEGEVAIESTGQLSGRSGFVGGDLTASSIVSDGRINVSRIETTNSGSLTVNGTSSPNIDRSGPSLISNADVRATQIALLGGDLVNSGSVVISGNTNSSGFALTGGNVGGAGAYQGSAGSFISVTGNTLLFGNVVLGAASVFVQNGDLSASGFLQQAANAQKIVTGNLNIARGVQTASTPPLSQFVRTLAQVNEDETERHEVEGQVVVGGNSQFDALVWIGQDGFFQVNGNALFDQVDIDGGLFVGGNATLNSAIISGAAQIEGALVADDITVDGTLQFNSGTIGNLTVTADAQLFANNFDLAGDFNNLGMFQLGDAEGGPGDFTIGGQFNQSGIFSGTGTLNGSLVQTSQPGGLSANALLFNPGFSPGILNITGDANFDEGVVLFEIGGLIPGVEHDQINVSGNLTIGPNAMIVVDLLELDDGSGVFLPRTGDEIVIFTASDISPDDVEQINFAVIDELPLGFTLVPDITQTDDGEIFRVLRGFDGSTLATLDGLNASQLAVAGALDFLSTSDSGVPSMALFNRAVDLQFADSFAVQSAGLTQLSATTLSALQGTALRAGGLNGQFMQSRLRTAHKLTSQSKPLDVARRATGGRSADLQAANSQFTHPQAETTANSVALAASAFRQSSGALSLLSGDTGSLRLIGQGSAHFGDQDTRAGTVGFDEEGWSASFALEYENAPSNWLIAASFSLGSIDGELDAASGGQTEAQSTGVGLYTSYDFGSLVAAASYSFADLDLDSERSLQAGLALGEADGSLHQFYGSLTAFVVDSDALKLGPKLALTHSDLAIDGFTERGVGDFALSVSELDRNATTLDLGMIGDSSFEAGDWSVGLLVEAGYRLALSGNDFRSVQTAFAAAPGTSFANPIRPLANDGVTLSSSLTLAREERIQLSINYSSLFAENGQEQHSLGLRASIGF